MSVTDDVSIGVVFYTDGGAKPNPGNIGKGAHGYIYEIPKSEEDIKVSFIKDFFITATGYRPKTKETENIKFVTPKHYIEYIGSQEDIATNNYAELNALNKILNYIKSLQNVKKVVIKLDSELTTNGIEIWCHGWKSNGWKKTDGGEIKNVELWKETYALYTELKERIPDFKCLWVRGHAGHLGNVEADKYASIGINYSAEAEVIDELTVHKAKDYWKMSGVRHPFLSLKRIYFNSLERHNEPGIYYMASSTGNDLIIGKRLPDTVFSVVCLKDPIPEIEIVREKQYDLANDENGIMLLKLDTLYAGDIVEKLNKHGKKSLLGIKQRGSNIQLVMYADKQYLTSQMNNSGLSTRAVNHLQFLEDLLCRYRDQISANNFGNDRMKDIVITDITDHFYIKKEKKVKNEITEISILRDNIGQGIKNFSLRHREYKSDGSEVEVKVPLVFGLDILPRNNLKKIESLNPKVDLLVWRQSQDTIRYATVITAGNDIGLWSNYFSDRIFL